ncbi:MAG: Na+/H+ antiporter NhaA [Nocardioidaceae bacterium]
MTPTTPPPTPGAGDSGGAAPTSPFPRVLSHGSWAEITRITQILRTETLGGALLLIATVLALTWANSPWSSAYESLVSYVVGPKALHLDLSLSTWAADGLLAIFFFVAGLELKREFIAGDLRDPRRAAVPIAAAIGGVVTPAVLYLVITWGTGAGTGWAIPTATDIAFALAVLAIIGSHLPAGLRTFLLTLAVVDDLIAITIIAFFYTTDLSVGALLLSLVPLALFAYLVQRHRHTWWMLIPLAAVTWTLVHESGVHATVAGVLLAFTVPVAAQSVPDKSDDRAGLAERFEHAWRPISTAFAVPVFAFFAAGVGVGGLSGLGSALSDRVAVGIIVGLVVGKTLGVFVATFLVHSYTHADLDEDLAWVDVLGVAALSGVGFTVSLLINTLAFSEGGETYEHGKVAVLAGSVSAAIVATIVLRMRNRVYRRICEAEELEARTESADTYGGETPHARP